MSASGQLHPPQPSPPQPSFTQPSPPQRSPPQPSPSQPSPPPQSSPPQQSSPSQPPPDGEDLKQRLEKLSRHYDVDTMKVFMVVEALGEASLHAVYNGQRKLHWEAFLQRQEACRLDLARHEKTRERYHQFLNEVGREEQGRQWFQAVLQTMHLMGATDIFHYLRNHTKNPASSTVNHHHHKHTYNNHSPRKHEALRYLSNIHQQPDSSRHQHHHHHHHHHHQQNGHHQSSKEVALLPLEPGGGGSTNFCHHLIKLFEKKLEAWFESFHAIAVRLTAHVKVSGLVRVLTGQVHALCTRRGRLHAVAVKVTAQETPRPLDVAELCLAKVMLIQNGLALPEDLSLALLTLHVHSARPVLRLWQLKPSSQMETAIRLADIDDMIDAGRLSQQHELWLHNTTMEPADGAAGSEGAERDWQER